MRQTNKLIQGLALMMGCALLSVSGNLFAGAGGGGGGNVSTEVTGQLVQPNGTVIEGSMALIGWLINRPVGHSNNGHGNNVDGVDSSNPGQGGGGPNGAIDQSDGLDDEIRIDPVTGMVIGPNEIRQVDNESGIMMYAYSSDDTGQLISMFPILEGGSQFTLWTEINGVYEFLDGIMVVGDPPTVAFTVDTKDPYVGSQSVVVNGQTVSQNIFRTRCDVGFTITAAVGNLSANAGDPLMARELNLYHDGRDMAFNDTADVRDYQFDQVGTYSINNVNVDSVYTWTGLSRLNGAADAKIGIEDVIVETFGGTWTSTDGLTVRDIYPWTVGSASVIVWPIASAEFTQTAGAAGNPGEPFVDGTVFVNHKIPDIFVNYHDLYPGSETYVQISKGVKDPTLPSLPILAVTQVPNQNLTQAELLAITNDIAQNTVVEGIKIRSVDLQQHINHKGNGTYTIEVLSGNMKWLNLEKNGDPDSPYYENIASATFEVAQSSTVRGQLSTK